MFAFIFFLPQFFGRNRLLNFSAPPLSLPPASFLLKEILFTSFLHKKMDTLLMTYTPLTFKKAKRAEISLVLDKT